MAKVKFKLNGSGVRELLKSGPISEECHQYATEILSRCGGVEGYVVGPRNYPERSGAAVYAEAYPAISDNLKNNTLLKAVGK